jgi:glucokinase-like ROK family protein
VAKPDPSPGRIISAQDEPDVLDATALVLDAIRLGRCSSRGQIVERTGLSRAVVAQRIAELVGYGIVEESGLGQSTGGRPPRQLRFRAEAGHVLTADLGATSIDVAVADLAGTVLAHAAEEADIAAGPERILTDVERLFGEVSRSLSDVAPLRGIGIGVPGPVEFSTGRPVSPPIMPGWHDYPIRARLERRYDAPVWVDNDVNIMVLGEWRFGVARGHRNVVWIKVGTGIGAGLISDGALHRGANGAAGDVGHIQVVDESIVCRCGNLGCLEALSGGAALARDGEAAARDGRSRWLNEALQREGSINAATVSLGATHGDLACVELIQGSGRQIGRMLASVVNFFNPSLIVVGGGVTGAGNLFLATIRETVYRRSLPLATRELQVLPSVLGPMAGVVGAATMVADELFSRDQLGATLARMSFATAGEEARRLEGPAEPAIS